MIAILTGQDAIADGLRPLRPTVDANVQTKEPFRFLPQPLLADGTVRYVGEPVALVVAETRNQALDAAERIIVDYEPLPAVVRADAALSPAAPQLAPEVPGNLCLDWHWGQTDAVADAIEAARHVVTLRLDNHRVVTNPMEPRGAIGIYDPPPAATRCMCPARTSTAIATSPPACWAASPPLSASLPRMSAAASARKTLLMPNMR